MCISAEIEKAAAALDNADALLIASGAGMGVDSGLPDFRGNEGFWKAYPPIAKLGISFYEMANPRWFFEDPLLAWAFYGHRLNLYRRTVPHTGFMKLLELGNRKPGGYFVFTSNVDGQFQKAGYSDELIEECHGSIHHFQCIEPCSHHIWDAADIEINVDENVFKVVEPLPRCINCGKLARPNVLMFGDWHWVPDRTDTQSLRHANWLSNLRREGLRLAIIEMGAGTAVATVRYHCEHVASVYDATLIRINPRDFSVPRGHISIPLGSEEGVRRITDLFDIR